MFVRGLFIGATLVTAWGALATHTLAGSMVALGFGAGAAWLFAGALRSIWR